MFALNNTQNLIFWGAPRPKVPKFRRFAPMVIFFQNLGQKFWNLGYTTRGVLLAIPWYGDLNFVEQYTGFMGGTPI